MIPAKQWSDNWQKKDFHLSLEQQFEAAQLDAFKAGAEWAANQVRLQQFQSDFPIENGDKMYFKIMDGIYDLKELPK